MSNGCVAFISLRAILISLYSCSANKFWNDYSSGVPRSQRHNCGGIFLSILALPAVQNRQRHVSILVVWVTFFVLALRCNIPDQQSRLTYRQQNPEQVESLRCRVFRAQHSACVCLSQSYCQAPRRLRQQQILTGDTHSIKEVLQQPDVLWRGPPRCLPARSIARTHTPPPDTKGCFYDLLHAEVLSEDTCKNVWWTWSYFTLKAHDCSFSCFSPLTLAEIVQTFYYCQASRTSPDWFPASQAATCFSSFQSIWKSAYREPKREPRCAIHQSCR